jgi:hypothetical protein
MLSSRALKVVGNYAAIFPSVGNEAPPFDTNSAGYREHASMSCDAP